MKTKFNPAVWLLSSFFILVPLLRCRWFFDSYLIKLWVVQLGAAVLIVLYCMSGRIFSVSKSVWRLLIGYLVVNILSWLSISPGYKYVALPGLTAIITYIVLCFLVSQYITKPDKVILVWIFTAMYAAILGICQHYRGQMAIAALGNENFLAGYIALTILVALGYFCHKRNRWCVIFAVPVLLILGAVLYFTKSRGSWLGLSAGLFSFGVIAFIRPGRRLLVSIIAILVIICGLCNIPWFISFVQRQFVGDVRPFIWESTIYMAVMKPALGWGRGAYFIFYPMFRLADYWQARAPTDLTVHAHNEFLQIWAETGIIGLFIFLILIISILRIGVKKADDPSVKYLMTGMVSGIICLLAHNLVCNNLQIPSSAIFMWMTLGLILGAAPGVKTAPLVRARPIKLLALTIIIAIITYITCVKSMVSQYFFKQGWNYRLKENWSGAIEKYLSAIKWDPWNVELHYRLAFAYVETDNLLQAVEKYNDVIGLAPDYGFVHKNMGIVYRKMGNYKLSGQSLIKARQINPYDAAVLENLAELRDVHK